MMNFKQIINIISGSVILVLIIVIIVLSCIVSSQSKTITIIKNDRNYLSQTIDKLKSESIKQQEILDEKNELLQEVKNSKSMKEYLAVWEKVNRSLK